MLALCGCESNTDDYADMTTEEIEDSMGVTAEKTGTNTYKVYGGVMDLCDYDGIALTTYTYKLTDDYLKEKSEEYMKSNTYYEEISTDIQSGDYLTCELSVSADGKEIEDYSGDERTISVGESDFGEKFDNTLIGKSVGDEGEECIEYDADYAIEAFAGKSVTISYKITNAERYVEPELTEENVKEIYGLDSIDEYYEYIRGVMESGYEDKTKSMYASQIFTYLLENCEFKNYNTALLDRYVEEQKENYEGYVDVLGVDSVEDVMEQLNISEDDIRTNNEKYIYEEMATYAIAEKEGLTVTDEELDEKVSEIMESYGYETEDDLYADYTRHLIRYWLYYDKVIDKIVEKATLDEVVQYDQDPFES